MFDKIRLLLAGSFVLILTAVVKAQKFSEYLLEHRFKIEEKIISDLKIFEIKGFSEQLFGVELPFTQLPIDLPEEQRLRYDCNILQTMKKEFPLDISEASEGDIEGYISIISKKLRYTYSKDSEKILRFEYLKNLLICERPNLLVLLQTQPIENSSNMEKNYSEAKQTLKSTLTEKADFTFFIAFGEIFSIGRIPGKSDNRFASWSVQKTRGNILPADSSGGTNPSIDKNLKVLASVVFANVDNEEIAKKDCLAFVALSNALQKIHGYFLETAGYFQLCDHCNFRNLSGNTGYRSIEKIQELVPEKEKECCDCISIQTELKLVRFYKGTKAIGTTIVEVIPDQTKEEAVCHLFCR